MQSTLNSHNIKNNPNIHANQQSTHWMRFDNKTFVAEDNLASSLLKSSGYGYRKVHYTEQVQQNKTLFGLGKDKVFFDKEWDIRTTENLNNLDPHNPDKIILRRLGHLYPTNSELRPRFFPKDDYNQPLKKCHDITAVPHFLHELGLFPASYYKSLFFTQDFQHSGMYHAVVNYNGRWQTDVVDDFIPVYQKSGKPIWGMDLQQPWQLILLKFWAKRCYVAARQFNYDVSTFGGYNGVKNSSSFQFVHCFSNSTWKFINLARDSDKFLRTNVNLVHKGHFILKTKNSNFVKQSGLILGEACYELINLVQEGQAKETGSGIKDPNRKNTRNYIATIRSCNKNTWTGKKSVLDPEFKQSYHNVLAQFKHTSKIRDEATINDVHSQQFGLDRCFTMEGKDLENLFSCCYITPRRIGGDFVANYYKFTYPANRTNAIYLQFDMPSEGFLDFSIKQLPSNRIQPSKKSRIQVEQHQKEHGDKNINSKFQHSKVQRYLKNKYILVKDNSRSDKTPPQQQFQRNYKPLHYQTYQIEYLKGYNTGDAHFLKAVKGRYILRFKSQTLNRDAHYVVNYTCKHDITFRFFEPNPQEQHKIMKDAMTSTIDKVKRITLRQNDQTQVIAYGNTFEYIGYGYVGVKLKRTSKMQVLIDVDPEQLKRQGYRLKHQYKKQTKPFAVVVNPGQATSIVLKKINQENTHSWPPRGISIFQK